ncbi:hypothetical protein LCGC14_0491690 [marine sediment metagenome]|uniref:Uncharacterized protein n=1 Tax=marine sediment metagenome TaxID=412755 RepID=A0A0F9UTC0_9ZZZZ
MAFELASLGIKLFINRWVSSKNKIKKMIDEYLHAAAKDKYIKNTDVVIIRDNIFQMIKTTEELNKSAKKVDKDLKYIIDPAKNYIKLLKIISERLPYEHLNSLLQLEGTVKEISFGGEIEITSDHEEIALICIYVADIVLTWIYDFFLVTEHIEVNYDASMKGIKFLLTAQKVLSGKRKVNENLKIFVNTYLLMYKTTSQYFLSRKKLKEMRGITNQLTPIGDGFNYVIRRIESILVDSEKQKLNEQYILSAKMILEHSTALLCEIIALKFNVKGLKSFKNLNDLSKASKEKTEWIYSEWESLYDQLKLDWGLEEFEESEIDYSVGESVNLFYDSNSKFDNEIEGIKSFEF